MWKRLKDQLVAETDNLTMGPTTDLSNFMGAVIDKNSFATISGYIDYAKSSPDLEILVEMTNQAAVVLQGAQFIEEMDRKRAEVLGADHVIYQDVDEMVATVQKMVPFEDDPRMLDSNTENI